MTTRAIAIIALVLILALIFVIWVLPNLGT